MGLNSIRVGIIGANVGYGWTPRSHAPAMDVLKSGQNIYTEWPLGANLKEAEELTALAKEKNL